MSNGQVNEKHQIDQESFFPINFSSLSLNVAKAIQRLTLVKGIYLSQNVSSSLHLLSEENCRTHSNVSQGVLGSNPMVCILIRE